MGTNWVGCYLFHVKKSDCFLDNLYEVVVIKVELNHTSVVVFLMCLDVGYKPVITVMITNVKISWCFRWMGIDIVPAYNGNLCSVCLTLVEGGVSVELYALDDLVFSVYSCRFGVMYLCK